MILPDFIHDKSCGRAPEHGTGAAGGLWGYDGNAKVLDTGRTDGFSCADFCHQMLVCDIVCWDLELQVLSVDCNVAMGLICTRKRQEILISQYFASAKYGYIGIADPSIQPIVAIDVHLAAANHYIGLRFPVAAEKHAQQAISRIEDSSFSRPGFVALAQLFMAQAFVLRGVPDKAEKCILDGLMASKKFGDDEMEARLLSEWKRVNRMQKKRDKDNMKRR